MAQEYSENKRKFFKNSTSLIPDYLNKHMLKCARTYLKIAYPLPANSHAKHK